MKENTNNEKHLINKKYYSDLAKFDRLTQQEIKDIYIKINQGDTKAINTLIEANLKLVVHFAKQYKNSIQKSEIIELDDLISEGNIGLIKSCEKYNPDLDIKFSYYASFWIKKAIQDFIMNNAAVIRSPQSKIISDNKIRKAANTLFQKNQYEVTENDIQNLDLFLPSEIKHYFSKPRANRIDADADFKDEVTTTDDAELKDKLKLVLKLITPQERMVVKMLYGIDTDAVHKPSEIGLKLGLSRQRINEVKLNALTKLKNLIA
jgi:RNA polymerase primary sigma factor